MSELFEDIWLPEVEAEYFALLRMNREVGVDVGNQFRAFEHILHRGVDRAWRAVDRCGSASVYVMYGRYALMFFAVHRRQAAIVKWTVLGTGYEQTLALAQAKQRAARQFP